MQAIEKCSYKTSYPPGTHIKYPEGEGHVRTPGPSGLSHRHHPNGQAPYTGSPHVSLMAVEAQTRSPINHDMAGARSLPGFEMVALPNQLEGGGVQS